MQIMKFRYLLAVFLFYSPMDIRAQVVELDSLALTALYNATGGPNWNNNNGWLEEDVPVKNWEGIVVTDTNVTVIYLPNNNLTGNLPDSLVFLSVLDTLQFKAEK